MTGVREVLREKRDGVVLLALATARGNRRRAATALGVSIRTLLYWLGDMRSRGVHIPTRPEARVIS